MKLASRVVRDHRLVRPRPIYPTNADQQREAVTTELGRVTLTSGGSANTEGAWTQITASTSVAASIIHLRPTLPTQSSGSDTGILLDLAVGDGSQNPVTTLVDDYQVGFNGEPQNTLSRPYGYTIPIHVPQGVELIGRIRAVQSSDEFRFSTSLYGGTAAPVFRNCTTYGADPSNSKGTNLATPGANNAKGAWTELDSAVSNPLYAIGWGFGGGGTSAFGATSRLFVDIGAGSVGNERVVVPDIYVQTTVAEAISQQDPVSLLGLTAPIGKGERLVARYQAQNTAMALDVIVYGFS